MMWTQRDGLFPRFDSPVRIGLPQFLTEAHNAFLKSASQPVEQNYSIADYNVKFVFANETLVSILMPALDHLRTENPAIPALTIYLWDSASTGVNMPPPIWSFEEVSTRGEIHGFPQEGIYAAFQAEGNALSLLDLKNNRAIYWTRDARELPSYERGSPFKNILHWWMSHHERAMAHAAAVSNEHGAALLIGRTMAGKSTTSFVCLRNGLQYLSDDYSLLRLKPRPVVYSLYNTGKQKQNSLERFPYLRQFLPVPDDQWQDKSIYFLHRHFPERIETQSNVKLILIPRVTELVETTVRPASAIEAMRAVAPSSVLQLPYANNYSLSIMSGMVRAVPCFHLLLGRDLERVPKIIGELLQT